MSWKCQVCGQPAVIHETALENGIAETRHYCVPHGKQVEPKMKKGQPPADALGRQADWFDQLTDAEKSRLREEYRMMRLHRRRW